MTHSHTAGPWHIGRDSNDVRGDRVTDIKGNDGTHVGSLRQSGRPSHEDTAEANAKLIAAAPDMLDMLYTVLPYIETLEQDKGYKPGAVNTVSRQIQTAIAKAEGR